jgi:hypothetical protein
MVCAGGFAGVVTGLTSGLIGIDIEFNRCYASGDVSLIDPDGVGPLNATWNSGGFSGYVYAITTNVLSVTIKNSVAANSKVILNPALSRTYINNARLIGFNDTPALTLTLDNNRANSGMLLADGAPTSTHADSPEDMLGGTVWGKGVPNTAASSGLKNAATWTALGWSADIWDFSTVPSLGRPVLKKN